MDNFKNNLIFDDLKKYYKYIIRLGFLNEKKKCFNKYISKNKFNNIKNKFYCYNYKINNKDEYLYLNKIKITNLENQKTNYLENNFSHYYYLKNIELLSEDLNIGYLLVSENNYSKIDCIDFPNLDIEKINKKITTFKIDDNLSINFEEISKNKYSIFININFDIKIIDRIIKSINEVLKLIYDNNINLVKI